MVPWILLWNLSACQGPEQSQELTKNSTAKTWVYNSSGGPWLGGCKYTHKERNDQSEETVRPAKTMKGSQSGMLLHPPTPVSLSVVAEAGNVRRVLRKNLQHSVFLGLSQPHSSLGIFLWVLAARGFQSLTANAGSHRNPANLLMNVSCFSEREGALPARNTYGVEPWIKPPDS